MTESNVCECWCRVCESPADECCQALYPLLEHNAEELATLARFDATEPAPESYVRQHRAEPECWCGPQQVGTQGVWMHNMGDPQ